MMWAPFSALMDDLDQRGDKLFLEITPDWMQGRTTYGGLTAALCLEAALRAFPDLPPLRSAQIGFVGPAGGDVRVTPSLLRRGKSVAFVGADLESGDGLAARAVFAFGAPRPSAFERRFTPVPQVPAPEDCELYMPEGAGPPFARHYDVRLARGARPISGSAEHDHYIWVRHKDAAATDIVALVALADMPPPAMMPMFKEPAPISTVSWSLNFLNSASETRDGWWLLQSRAENASDGYSSQDMLAWNRDGEAVIAGRQSVAIFI